MLDWEEVKKAESTEELKKAKLWLFQENIRLQNERRELEKEIEAFRKEREQFKKELRELNRKADMEQKRLKEQERFFEKKMMILQNGFRQLEEDRHALESQRREMKEISDSISVETVDVDILFRSIKNNPLALRKRYKDLLKIFHPDNLYGDGELVQRINQEYLRRNNGIKKEQY